MSPEQAKRELTQLVASTFSGVQVPPSTPFGGSGVFRAHTGWRQTLDWRRVVDRQAPNIRLGRMFRDWLDADLPGKFELCLCQVAERVDSDKVRR